MKTIKQNRNKIDTNTEKDKDYEPLNTFIFLVAFGWVKPTIENTVEKRY
ncbi:MAG: hypothetical protein IT249_06675 [Chitinophagaceae bacterium]|nr:hypothetical protein [Chitinophagaceae bacterium]